MADKVCEICETKITTLNQIISRKDQTDKLNYFYFKRLTAGSNMVKRMDISFDFHTDDGERIHLCRTCFQFIFADMINHHMLGSNWFDQEDKGE